MTNEIYRLVSEITGADVSDLPPRVMRLRPALVLARLRLETGDRGAAAEALVAGARADPIRIREELRQNPLWIPLKEMEEVGDLLSPTPARGPR